jgi:anti-sigma factor RsiW
MSHLGSQLSALVDGQLPPAAAERALEHVAGCAECAAELRAARTAREALWAATDVPPAPDLTARLLALGSAADDGAAASPRRMPRGGEVVGFGGSVPLPGHDPLRVPRGCLQGDVVQRRVPRPVLVAALGCVGAFLGGLVALGGQPPVVPETQRSYALALLAGAPAEPRAEASPSVTVRDPSGAAGAAAVSRWFRGTAGADPVQALPDPAAVDALGPRSVVTDVSLTGDDAHQEVLSWMQDHGWVSPVTVPASFRVTGLRLDTGGPGSLELDLMGPSGPVVVVQEHGRLHPEALRGTPVSDVGGRAVHVVCNDPWYVVWQSGDSVVTVVAAAPTTDVLELVAAHPAGPYDDGVTARLSRGWQALTGSWVP